jgi:hypothetical protein
VPATITTSTLAAGYTQQTLADALVAAFEAAWGAPASRYTINTTLRAVWAIAPLQGGDRNIWFVLDVGNTYLVQCGTTTSFTAPSTTGSVITHSSSTFSSTASPVALTMIRLPNEMTLLCLNQGASQRGFFGLITPPTLSSWWVRANASPWLMISSGTFGTAVTHTTGPHAYGPSPTNIHTGYSNFNTVGILSSLYENPALGRRELVPHLSFCAQYGVAGFTSADLALMSASGLAQWDVLVVSPGVEEYLMFTPPSNQAYAVRTV